MNLQLLLNRRNALVASIGKIREVEAALAVELAAADQELTAAIAKETVK